ncbi:MAG: hypothetical protein H7X93_11540 [Sphingomonadaceae bacterium]|nr:hypothetical protein [Sphingomonadaceae bacterium]
MKYIASAAVFAAFSAMPAAAQDATESPLVAVESPGASGPVVAQVRAGTPAAFLPANTEILLGMAETISTNEQEEGYMFRLTVRHDVMLDDYVVIPRGTPAFGEITWRTGRGMFGKSGKMDVELRYIELDGRRIPVTGTYRQEGEGNTAATIAGVVIIPVAGLFITGRSGVIPEGRELVARTAERLPVTLSDANRLSETPAVAQPAAAEAPATPEA